MHTCSDPFKMLPQTSLAYSVHSLHSVPQQSCHIKLRFQKQQLPILLSLIYQFQEQLTGNTGKTDPLTSFHFFLKTLLCCTDLWNLDNGLANALWKPHEQCLLLPICLSLCVTCPWLTFRFYLSGERNPFHFVLVPQFTAQWNSGLSYEFPSVATMCYNSH